MNTTEYHHKRSKSIYDVHYLCTLFLTHKKWFALSIISCLAVAALYLYVAKPAYNMTGKMLVVDRKSSSSASSAAINASMLLSSQLPFGLGSSLGGSIGIENEKEILKSRWLGRAVVNELGLYTEYRRQTLLRSPLLYKTQPVNVAINPEALEEMDEELSTRPHSIKLTIRKTSAGYTVEGKAKVGKSKEKIPEQTFAALPATVKTSWATLTLTENRTLTAKQRKPYEKEYKMSVTIVAPLGAARAFCKRLDVRSATKKAASTLLLSLKDESIRRGIDYIDMLIVKYNERNNKERHDEAAKNDTFVEERLAKIDQELGATDTDFENFKKLNQVTDPKVDAQEVITKKSEYEVVLVNLGIQLELLDYLQEYVMDPAHQYDLIPVNIGAYGSNTINSKMGNTTQSSLAATSDAVAIISRHNALVSERNNLLTSVTEKSTQVQKLTLQIDELRPIILSAISRDRKALTMRKGSVEQEFNKYLSRVSNAPQQERVLTEITRLRNIKQGVYLTLLQKREENAMDIVTFTDKGRKIDQTMKTKKVKPTPLLVLPGGLVAGLLLPYLFLFGRRWTRRSIGAYENLSAMTDFPVLGYIPTQASDSEESFRRIRNQLSHQLQGSDKTVLVTSYGEGAGKTYTACHLAASLAQAGQRVVVCELNFRHPSLTQAQEMTHQSGLAHLLLEKEITATEVMSAIRTFGAPEGYDQLLAGAAQQVHPADLTAHQSLKSILTILRERYEYVVLDAPAIGIYEDVLIGGLADLTCYVCQPQSKRQELNILTQLTEQGRIPAPCLVMNQVTLH